MKNFNDLKGQVAAMEADAVSFFEKSNKSAGTRLRVALQAVKQTAQLIREEVTAKKNNG